MFNSSKNPGTGENPEWPDSPGPYIHPNAAAAGRMLIVLNREYGTGIHGDGITYVQSIGSEDLSEADNLVQTQPNLEVTRAKLRQDITDGLDLGRRA